jgi:hypothetical protein
MVRDSTSASRRYYQMMSMNGTLLILSTIPGGIGFVLLVLAKKYGRLPHFVAGVAFMAYPYFVESVLSMVAVGVAISVAFWLALRAGW